MICNVDAGSVVAKIGAQVPCQQRMLFGRIVAEKKNGRSCSCVRNAGKAAFLTGQGAGEGNVIGGAMVVNIVGSESAARNFLEKVGFLIGNAR